MAILMSYDDLVSSVQEYLEENGTLNSEQILLTMLKVQAKYAEETTRLLDNIDSSLIDIASDVETMPGRLRRLKQ